MSRPAEISRVYKTRERIVAAKTVPRECFANLDKGLLLTFGQPMHHSSPSEKRLGTKLYQNRWRLKNSGIVYRNVCNKDPHIFLPYILSVSPRGCESYSETQFDINHSVRYKIQLSEDCYVFLHARAKNLGVSQNSAFQDYMTRLLEPDHTPKQAPPTDAESENNRAYHLAHVESISNVFGSFIQKAITSSIIRLNETANSYVPDTTESVCMRLPRQTMEDAILNLDVGTANELARILFPHMSRDVAAFLWPQTSKIGPDESLQASQTFENACSSGNLVDSWDNAYCTLQGASLAAIKSVFSPCVYAAIQSSHLRRWETQMSILETTDCVTLNVWRSRPLFGFIRLRIGFSWSASFLNDLYV